MPRQARFDAPGTLDHVMVWGIERTAIVRDGADRTDCVGRLAVLVGATGLTVYAWALLPNHAHLLSGRDGGRSPVSCARSSPATPRPSIAAATGSATCSRTGIS